MGVSYKPIRWELPAVPLTDTAIRHTPARERSYKISDSGGLFLLVNPIGSRLWRFKYRYDGREKLLSFGPYPVTSLRRARVKRDEAKALLLDGRDPGEVKRTARRAAERQRTNTFGQIGDEYQDKLRKEGRAHRTLEKVRWLLDFTKQRIADRPITEIDAPEILSVLREIEVPDPEVHGMTLRDGLIRFCCAETRRVCAVALPV